MKKLNLKKDTLLYLCPKIVVRANKTAFLWKIYLISALVMFQCNISVINMCNKDRLKSFKTMLIDFKFQKNDW